MQLFKSSPINFYIDTVGPEYEPLPFSWCELPKRHSDNYIRTRNEFAAHYGETIKCSSLSGNRAYHFIGYAKDVQAKPAKSNFFKEIIFALFFVFLVLVFFPSFMHDPAASLILLLSSLIIAIGVGRHKIFKQSLIADAFNESAYNPPHPPPADNRQPRWK